MNTYSKAIGHGFDFGSEVLVQFEENNFVADTSVYFSVKLPEGNYNVQVILGGTKKSVTTIKAESRRLMIQEKTIAKDKSEIVSFNVHVHNQAINNTSQKVNLKSRELNHLNWDEKLTLEFLGNSAVQKITIAPIDNITTLFLAGDSTVTDQDLEPWASWGQFLTNYVNQDAVVANYAASGSSLPSFKSRKRLEKILSLMKKGDYIIIEFGHNDEKIKGEGNGAYGLYTDLLKEFINKAREKKGIPILVTPTERRSFREGKVVSTHGDFPDAMRRVAVEKNVPLIDITKITGIMYTSWGAERSRKAFVHYPAYIYPGQSEELKDNTHFNSFGANEIALAFIQSVKEQNLPLKKFLKHSVPTYDAENPNHISKWTLPISTRFESIKPYGN